jgi:hypothetical protein
MLDDEHPCNNCTICCEHVALPIDTPRTKEDWQHILWYVSHENVNVYKDHDNDWHVEFKTSCKFLDNDGLCKVYDERPDVCRDYSWEECEKHGEGNFFKIMFSTRKDVIRHVKKNTRIKKFPQ